MNTQKTIQQLQTLERLFARIDAVTKNVSHNVSEISAYNFDKQYEGLAKVIKQLDTVKDANSLSNALKQIANGGSAQVTQKVARVIDEVNKIAPLFKILNTGTGKRNDFITGYANADLLKSISASDITSKGKITDALKKFTLKLSDAQIKLIQEDFNYITDGIKANLPGDRKRRPLVTYTKGITKLRDLVIDRQIEALDEAQGKQIAAISEALDKTPNDDKLKAEAEKALAAYDNARSKILAETTDTFKNIHSAMDIFTSKFKGFGDRTLKSYLVGPETPKKAKRYMINSFDENPSTETIDTIKASMDELGLLYVSKRKGAKGKNKNKYYADEGHLKYIIGLSDAEIALAQSSDRVNVLMSQQGRIVDQNSVTAHRLTEEIKKLNKEQAELALNTTSRNGFTKSRINEAVSAFTKELPIAEAIKSVPGIPFWLKEYYKAVDSKGVERIFTNADVASKYGKGGVYETLSNPAYNKSINGVFGENRMPYIQDLVQADMAQDVRRGNIGSLSNIKMLLNSSSKGANNLYANPSKFAEDIERFMSSRFTVYSKVMEALNLGGDTSSNPYKKLIENLQGSIRNGDGSLKSNEELRTLFASDEFKRLYLNRAISNIKGFESKVLSNLSEAQREAVLQEIDRVNKVGRMDVNGDMRKLYTGHIGNIIENVTREGGIQYSALTEREFLYQNYNANIIKAQRSLNAEAAQTIPLFERIFNTKRTETYTGALNNLRSRFNQVMYDIPNILQTLNLSYTKAAFAISRVAYGVRIISMEMTALGMTAKNVFMQMMRSVVGYTNAITKATETQAKAKITLTGVFNPKMADNMVEFAKQYSVTSPATFGEVTQMLKSFGLTPQIKNMITESKDLNKTLKELSYVTVGLASTKPQQGIEGAMFALREAMSGQFVSLKRRFEISPEVIASMVGKSRSDLAKDPKLFMEAMKRFLDLNVGEDTLEKLAMTYEVQINNIKDFMERAQAMIGNSGFYDSAIKSANSIADAFAGILDTNLFKEKMQNISGSLMSISDSLINGISDMINRVIKMDDSGAASQIKANLLKDDKNKKLSDSDIDRRVKYGLSLIRISSAISMGFNMLAHATEKVVGWFNKLTDGLVLDEKIVLRYFTVVSELVEGFVNLAGKLIGLYASYVKWVSSLQLTNDFLRGALLMMGAFPVATMNIAINTFRALFESILAVANPVVWESFGQLTMNLRQFSGELVNTTAAALSFKGARTELDVLFGGMPLPRKYSRQKKDSTGAAMFTEGGNPIMETIEEMVTIPAMDMKKFTNRMTKAFANSWIYAFTGIRTVLAGVIGAILISAIAEGIGEGNTGIKKAVLRVAGMFSYIGERIETVFGTGWIGEIVKKGGFFAILFPVASYNLILGMISGIKTAAIGAFNTLMTNKAMLAWVASLGLAITAAGYIYNAANTTPEVAGLKSAIEGHEAYQKNAWTAKALNPNAPFDAEQADANMALIAKNNYERAILANEGVTNRLINMAKQENLIKNASEFKEGNLDKILTKDFLERALIGFDKNKGEATITEGAQEAFKGAFAWAEGLLPSINDLEKKGETAIGSFSNMFDFFGRKSGDAMEAMQAAFEKAKERAHYFLSAVTKEATPGNPLKGLLKEAMQKEQALNASLTPVQETIDKYVKNDKEYAVREVEAIRQTFDKAKPAIIQTRAEVYALNAAVNSTQVKATGLYGALQMFSGLAFTIPIMLQLQWAQTLSNIPTPFGLSGLVGLKNLGAAIKASAMKNLISATGADHKAEADVKTINDSLDKAYKLAQEKAGGGANKASEQKQKYESMMKSLESDILEAHNRSVEARIRAAKHEKEQKLEEIKQEFNGTKYYEELKTKVIEAEAAKRIKIEDDIRKDLYSKISDSKFSSVESVMKAYGWLQGKERTKQINDITDALKHNIISQGVANELLAETESLYKSNMIEKYYETLKKQPTLADILGGKDAEKILDTFNVKLAKYVQISEKNLSLIKNAKIQWDLVGTSKTKTESRQTTESTYQLMGKIPSRGVEGDTVSATRTAMEALRTAYYQNSIVMLKMEIEQEKKLSDEQMRRMSNDDFEKRFGVTKEYAVLLRDIISQTRILAQAEEQYYKMKEQRMQETNSIAQQMNFALTEQVRKLPTQYDVVKSATESMFGTLRDGLSNTLAAAFSGDVNKMKDTWKEFLTTLKNTFLKMIADLVVNNLLKSVFSGLMGKEEKEKSSYMKGYLGMFGGDKASKMTIAPGIEIPSPSSLMSSIADPLSMASTQTASMMTSSLMPAMNILAVAAEQAALALSSIGGGAVGGDWLSSVDDSTASAYESATGFIDALTPFAGFATGGVVSAPTLAMIGEGGSNEAVVPLPDGKAIPVDMKGNNTPQTQNLTIINVVSPDILDEFVARNPGCIINTISADTLKGGPTYQAIKAKSGK